MALPQDHCDIAVIGGGVIGCTIARALLLSPNNYRVALLDKEPSLGAHQSSHNSGVVHVGYNQKPGSLKAKFVVEGSKRLRAYCQEKAIPLRQKGILVVASTDDQLDTLQTIHSYGTRNGARVDLLGPEDLRKIEPHADGLGALHAPEGASFDPQYLLKALHAELISLQARILLNEPVLRIHETSQAMRIETTRRSLTATLLINAAGLHADRLAHQLGVGSDYRIVPFRGEYYELVPEKTGLVNSHIYPAPDLNFPFLGVHLSKTFDGKVTIGPGAMLAFGREAYSFFDFSLPDTLGMLSFGGFWRMFSSPAFRELMKTEWKKSFLKSAVCREAARLVPGLKPGDLIPCKSGVRAQLVSSKGAFINDLLIEETPRSVQVLNAVSPALTCSFPFADHVVSIVSRKLNK
ncbi:MAG TPA: L-2-hydroxyglutarate oxidase [Elusimicrobiota bacterium]|nr:L-2-hydroxyglutarate oxidase [Elusimicrobiota bacterium]